MTTATIKTYHLGRLLVVLDRDRVVKDDPGADTPALVYLNPRPFCAEPKSCDGSATLWCAEGEGEIEGYKLTRQECRWLSSLIDAAEEFLYVDPASVEREHHD
jgi:hypothetical protein